MYEEQISGGRYFIHEAVDGFARGPIRDMRYVPKGSGISRVKMGEWISDQGQKGEVCMITNVKGISRRGHRINDVVDMR